MNGCQRWNWKYQKNQNRKKGVKAIRCTQIWDPAASRCVETESKILIKSYVVNGGTCAAWKSHRWPAVQKLRGDCASTPAKWWGRKLEINDHQIVTNANALELEFISWFVNTITVSSIISCSKFFSLRTRRYRKNFNEKIRFCANLWFFHFGANRWIGGEPVSKC